MIESQDFYIGRVLDYLKKSGQLENTLIFYIPDNGPEGANAFGPLSNDLWVNWVGDYFDMSDATIGTASSSRQIGLEWTNATTGFLQWWKWFAAEGGVRAPLIVRPPASSPFSRMGELSSTTSSIQDVPLTIMNYARIQHPGNTYIISCRIPEKPPNRKARTEAMKRNMKSSQLQRTRTHGKLPPKKAPIPNPAGLFPI